MYSHLKIFVICLILPLAMAYGNLFGDSDDCPVPQDNCGCQKHPQEILCNAQFVIKGKIVNAVASKRSGVLFRHITYEVNIDAVFKGIGILASENLFIHKPVDLMCYMEVGENYIITGYIDATGRLQSDGCQWIAKWNKLTSFQQQGLISGAYLDNCNSCNITKDLISVPYSGTQVSSGGTLCSFDFKSCEGQFNFKKRSCVLCGDQQECSWVRNDRYERCSNPNIIRNPLGRVELAGLRFISRRNN